MAQFLASEASDVPYVSSAESQTVIIKLGKFTEILGVISFDVTAYFTARMSRSSWEQIIEGDTLLIPEMNGMNTIIHTKDIDQHTLQVSKI